MKNEKLMIPLFTGIFVAVVVYLASALFPDMPLPLNILVSGGAALAGVLAGYKLFSGKDR